MRATTAIAMSEAVAARRPDRRGSAPDTGRRLLWRIGLALLGFVFAPRGAEGATARVQYLSSSSVYLDAGRAAGIEAGATVRVERNGQVVAELLVEFVAQSSAACKIVSSVSPIRVGDTCTFTPAAGSTPAAPGAAAGAARASDAAAGSTRRTPEAGAGWLRPQAMHGSLAFSYRRSGETEGSYSNPAVRANLRWDGPDRRQLTMHARADRPVVDFESSPGSSSAATTIRLYEAEMRYRSAAERFELSGGRFVPTRLEPMGYLDGAAAVFQPTAGLRLGAMGGAGARLVSGGFETEGWKAGGYVEARDPRRNAPTRWRLLLAAAILEDADVTRRQFVLGRADQRLGTRLRTWENFEIDVNPGWKVQRGEDRVEFTAGSLGAQATLHRNVDVTLDFDSRRGILLPEQRAVPIDDLVLDRTHGVHGAVHVHLSRWMSLRLGGDWRALEDGTRTTRSWDGSLYGSHPRLPTLSAIVHANVYDATPGRGEILDASLSLRATPLLRLSLAGGTFNRRDLQGSAAASDPRSNWLRIGGGLDPGWGLWMDGNAEWRSAPSGTELHLELGWRF